MHSVAVVVPVYKEKLSLNESLSLKQCMDVFNDVPIIFVSAFEFTSDYLKDIPADRRVYFDNKYFSSIAGYNRLMLSRDFYIEFMKYEYILIYQLDAYVFRNDLQFWCDRQYDYIGAPWMRHGGIWKHAGNGGFSLRRVATFIELLGRKKARYSSIKQLIGCTRFIVKMAWRFPGAIKRYFSDYNRVNAMCENPKMNEDQFYSIYGKRILREFKVADPVSSIPFSFEVDPDKLFILNKRELPFGCHAFERNKPSFWKDYIPLECEDNADFSGQ